MKILHVNKFFDLHRGAEIYMQTLMEEQRKAGHEVHAFSTQFEKNVPSPDSRFFVERFHMDKREGMLKDAQKALAYLWNVEAKKSFEQQLKEVKPDVIHLHNIYHHLSTSILAPIRALKIPCVQTLHDYKLACPNYRMYTKGAPCERCKGGQYQNAIKYQCLATGLLPNVLAALEMGISKTRQSYERTVRLFLCPSRFMKEKMQDWGEPASKLRYVPNPTIFPETPAPRGGGYILYAGSLSAEKGVDTFITAAAAFPDLPVKLVGRGPDEERLRALVRELGANHIEFVGFRAPSELTEIRRLAEAVVLPSVWYENASGALLEPLADGIPCLATRIGGNPELVDDGIEGFLVKPGDIEDWKRAIKRFTETNIGERMAMGEAGRKKIRETRTWRLHTEVLEEIYQEVGANK
ncbi:glycosyltransferase family 4 protein [Patescibacteria group bacterium]|nr:glycosyltransferase family 4 protein [Patescibacteria group bacterium]